MSFFKGERNVDQIGQLADAIDHSNNIVAITGAGISISGGGITYGQLARTIRPGGFGSDRFLHAYVKRASIGLCSELKDFCMRKIRIKTKNM